jgi:large subunit ribosomal protein L32
MGVPKHRKSKSRRDMRRSQTKKEAPNITTCPECGEAKQPHHACPSCGAYKDHTVTQAEKE